MAWLILGFSGSVLPSVILYRAFRVKTFKTYPFFYAYVASTLSFLAPWIVYLADSRSYFESYARWYWPIELVTLIFGCGIVLEILRHVLSAYPGAEKFAMIAGIVTFIGAFSVALASPLVTPGLAAAGTLAELERNLRSVQAILLFGVFAVILLYRIPLGRNMKGMILGYGIYVGTSLASLALRAYPRAPFHNVWRFAQPVSFLISLSIWLAALWSYHPNPVPDSDIGLEDDYDLLVSHTRRALDMTRSYLGRAMHL